MSRESRIQLGVFLMLVAAGAATRLLLSDLPNFAPVAAIALFAGYFFQSRRLAMMVPISVMVISDTMLGFYDWKMMALVYGALVMPAVASSLVRGWLRSSKPGTSFVAGVSLASCSLGASLTFFAVTNFGSWLWFDLYEHSWAGLMQCYLQALPFFRYTLAGDAIFAVVLFGGYALLAERRTAAKRSKTVEPETCG